MMDRKVRALILALILLVTSANIVQVVYGQAGTPIPPAIPTALPTATPVPTQIPPTATDIPTATTVPTQVPPTPVPPTDTPPNSTTPPTATPVPPTETAVPPTETATPTETLAPETVTPTATGTETTVPPTATLTTPTLTPTANVVRTDTLILSYSSGASEADIAALVAGVNGVEVKRIPEIRRILVRVPATLADPNAARAALTKGQMTAQSASLPIEVNGKYRAFAFVPNDPLYSSQTDLPILHAESAWDIATTRGSGVVVAVVDTGVNASHPDLVGHTVTGYDFQDDDPNTLDLNGHGTHVAGTIVAGGNNSKGVIGIAFNAKVMPVRVLGTDGTGSYVSIAQGIIYAADHGAKIINLSLGGRSYSSTVDASIQYAVSKNVTVFAAAGNCGPGGDNDCATYPNGWDITQPHQEIYPALLPSVITVSSVHDDGTGKSNFSNYGKVDIAAPGEEVLSTCLVNGIVGDDHPCAADSPYFRLHGTSMATPHVAAAAALIIGAGVATTPAQIKAALTCGAETTGFTAPAYDPAYYGAGLLQLDYSLNWRQNSSSCKNVLSNDNVRTPIVIPALPFKDSQAIDGTNASTSTEDPTSACAVPTPRQTIWYKYTPTISGPVQFSTFGSSYDTAVSLYKGDPGSMVEIACNNNYPGTASPGQTDLTVDVIASQVYNVMVSTVGISDVNGAILNFSVNPGILVSTKIEDNAANMAYSGTWTSYSHAGQSGTVARTDSDTATLSFTIRSVGIILARTKGPSQGSMDVYVDGAAPLTIDNRGAIYAYQQQYLVPTDNTLKTRQIVIKRHPGSPVGPLDFDWVQGTNNPTLPVLTAIAGQVDDRDTRLYYGGTWSQSAPIASPNPPGAAYKDTLTFSTDAAAKFAFKFTGTSATLLRSTGPAGTYNNMNIRVDGALYTGAAVSNVASDGAERFSVPYVIYGLSNSEHIVIIDGVGPSSKLAIDSIKIASPVDLVAGTKADDANVNILYSGAWTANKPVTSAFMTTTMSTQDTQATAVFTFTGTSFVVGYASSGTGASLDIFVDGALYDTFSTNNAPQFLIYNSVNAGGGNKLLTLAKHTVLLKFKTPGQSITLDSIQPLNYPTLKSTSGLVPETSPAFNYTGTWTTFAWPRLNGGAAKVTSGEGATIDFWINGTGFLFYGDTNPDKIHRRGFYRAEVDGIPIAEYIFWDPTPAPGQTITIRDFSEYDNRLARPLAFGVVNLLPGIHHVVLTAHMDLTDPAFPGDSVSFDGVRVFP